MSKFRISLGKTFMVCRSQCSGTTVAWGESDAPVPTVKPAKSRIFDACVSLRTKHTCLWRNEYNRHRIHNKNLVEFALWTRAIKIQSNIKTFLRQMHATGILALGRNLTKNHVQSALPFYSCSQCHACQETRIGLHSSAVWAHVLEGLRLQARNNWNLWPNLITTLKRKT